MTACDQELCPNCPVVGIMAGVVVARRDFRRRDGDES